MCGPEEWPSCRGDPADRIRLIGPAANYFRPGPSLRSGFRLAAQTPPKRLNLQVRLPILLCFQIPHVSFWDNISQTTSKPPSHAPHRRTPQAANRGFFPSHLSRNKRRGMRAALALKVQRQDRHSLAVPCRINIHRNRVLRLACKIHCQLILAFYNHI